MIPARVRALYKSITESLDEAQAEAALERNRNIIYHIEEAQEMLELLIEGFDEDVEELNFE